MKSALLILQLCCLLLVISCKKKEQEPISEDPAVSYIAPCEIVPKGYDSMEVHYDGSLAFPQALYRLVLRDTNAGGMGRLEVAFNKVPESGMYSMVRYIQPASIEIPNQIAFCKDSGSFWWRSNYSVGEEVYIEKTAEKITISYCTITGTEMFFDSNTLEYIGNPLGPFKIRMNY